MNGPYPEIFQLHIALGNCGQYLGELHEAIDQGVVHVVQIQAVMACPCLIIQILYQIYPGFIHGALHASFWLLGVTLFFSH